MEEVKEKDKMKIPLIIPSVPHREALLKHIEGAEFIGNESLAEENFYYCGALVVNFGGNQL